MTAARPDHRRMPAARSRAPGVAERTASRLAPWAPHCSRRRAARCRGLPAVVACLALGLAAAGCGDDGSGGKRVIVLGIDGLDHGLLERFMAEGRLPNFARLAREGDFAPLQTTMPPLSPVAWSTFITGLDPGGHGIFDFVHRDPATMQPVEPFYSICAAGPVAGARIVGAAARRPGGDAVPAGAGAVGAALRGGRRHHRVPDAGQLSAGGDRRALVRRHGHPGPAGNARHLLALHERAARERSGNDRPGRAGRRRRAARRRAASGAAEPDQAPSDSARSGGRRRGRVRAPGPDGRLRGAPGSGRARRPHHGPGDGSRAERRRLERLGTTGASRRRPVSPSAPSRASTCSRSGRSSGST